MSLFCCSSRAVNWNESRLTSNARSQRHSHIFHTKIHRLWKQNIWGNSSQGANCQKKWFCVYVELFPCLVLLVGWPRAGTGEFCFLGSSGTRAEWPNSPLAAPKAISGLCCRARLHPNNAVFVPIDPSLYSWRAFSSIIPLFGWVPGLCLWDPCRDHSCPWCLSAQLCGVFPHLHIHNVQFSSQFTIFRSVLHWALVYSQKGGVRRDGRQMSCVYPVPVIS